MKTPELQKTWDSIQELSQLQIRPDVRTILNDATKNPEKFHALRALGLTTPPNHGPHRVFLYLRKCPTAGPGYQT